jgi:hypothetical protein
MPSPAPLRLQTVPANDLSREPFSRRLECWTIVWTADDGPRD